MAINKKLIHFNKKATFNSQKLSANDSNTQYQVGGTGTVQTGAPDINYQSIVYIKDSKEIWTHGQFYATAVTWSTITGKPSFATVATSGSYTDLTNKPTIPTSLPTPNSLTFTGATTGTWNGSAAKTVNIPTYSNASTSSAGLMSTSDKSKLNGIASGAEVNQNAFSNVVVGSTTIAADSKTDTLTLTAGSNITLTPNATNDSITISASGSSYSLPLASNRTRGGIKLSSSTQGGTPNGITTTSGRTYAVQVNSSEQAVVNVPWTDTTYTLPTASASTLGGVKVGNGLSISNGVLSTGNYVSNVEVGSPSTDWQSAYVPMTVSYRDGSTTDRNISLPMASDGGTNGSAGLMSGTDKKKLDSLSATPNMIKSRDSKVECDTSSNDITVYAPSAGVNITCKDPIGLTVSDEVVATFNVDSDLHADITLGGGYNNIHIKSGSSAGSGIIIQADDGVRITGSVEASGGFFDTSDARVKANVKEIDASDADKVKLVEFDRTDKEHHGYGVIAQELEKVYPEMVNTDSEGFKSVNYNELAMVKIKYLEDKVARLEALVGRLLAE